MALGLLPGVGLTPVTGIELQDEMIE